MIRLLSHLIRIEQKSVIIEVDMGYRGRRIAAQEYTDLDTGEILQYGNLVATPLPKPGIGDDFFMSRQTALMRLAKDKGLSGDDLRVLLVYMACVGWENKLETISHQWIADELEMQRSNVSRSTKKLVDAKILIEGEKIGRHKQYSVNDFYGWKGDSNNYQKKAKAKNKLEQKTI